MAVRRQSGITAIRALKRIVELLHVSSHVLYLSMRARSERCSVTL
jgi:hypothetical protein